MPEVPLEGFAQGLAALLPMSLLNQGCTPGLSQSSQASQDCSHPCCNRVIFKVLSDPNQAGVLWAYFYIPIVVFYFISGLVSCPFPELCQGIPTESEPAGMGPPHADLFQPSSGIFLFFFLSIILNSQPVFSLLCV